MKRILSFLALFFLIACANDTKTSTFELSQSSFEINKPQQTIVVRISSNSSWQAIDIPEWITLKQTQGNGNSDLEIVVSQNDDQDGQTRIGNVEFVSDNKLYILTIVQTAIFINPITILNNKVYHLDFNKQVFTIEISSTLPWYVQSKPDWVQVNIVTGNAGTTSVEITIPENNTLFYRSGNIIFSTETPLVSNYNTVLDLDQKISPILPNPNSPTLYYWDLIKGNVEISLDYTRELQSRFKNNTYYLMHSTRGTVHLDVFNGSWNNYGDLVDFNDPLMTVGKDGSPYILSYSIKNRKLQLSQFNGLNSTPITTQLDDSAVRISNLAIDSNDNIYFSRNSSIYNSTTDKYDNKLSIYNYASPGMTTIGNFTERSIFSNFIKIDSNNIPFIAYTFLDNSGSFKSVIKKYNGSSWNNVEGISENEIIDDFQIGTDNSLYVAYRSGTIKKFINNSWSTIGNFIGSSTISLDNNNIPYIYNNRKISRLVNSKWMLLEPFKILYNNQVISYDEREFREVTMTFDQDNKLIVAFSIGGYLSLKVLKYRD